MLLPFCKTHSAIKILRLFALTAGFFISTSCQESEYVPPARRVTLNNVPYRSLNRLIPPAGYWDNPKYPELIKLTAVSSVREEVVIEPRERWGQMAHRVRRGETLLLIARAYYGNDQWGAIYNNNLGVLSSAGQLREGQLLYLPLGPLETADGKTKSPLRRPDYYVVDEGDSLAQIAKIFLGDPQLYNKLAGWNHLTEAHQLRAGRLLSIPKNN